MDGCEIIVLIFCCGKSSRGMWGIVVCVGAISVPSDTVGCDKMCRFATTPFEFLCDVGGGGRLVTRPEAVSLPAKCHSTYAIYIHTFDNVPAKGARANARRRAWSSYVSTELVRLGFFGCAVRGVRYHAAITSRARVKSQQTTQARASTPSHARSLKATQASTHARTHICTLAGTAQPKHWRKRNCALPPSQPVSQYTNVRPCVYA